MPYYTASTATQMELIEREDEGPSSDKGYLTFAASDREGPSYVLLVPKSMAAGTYRSADMNRAVPLRGEALTSLISGIDQALGQWAAEKSEGRGQFYEFVHAPEQDVRSVSKNVIEYYASVRFTASHTPKGPTARLVLGASPKEQLQSVYTFTDKDELRTLRSLLTRGQERARSMGKRAQAARPESAADGR